MPHVLLSNLQENLSLVNMSYMPISVPHKTTLEIYTNSPILTKNEHFEVFSFSLVIKFD